MTRDQRIEFIDGSGFFDGDTDEQIADPHGSIDRYFTLGNFIEMCGPLETVTNRSGETVLMGGDDTEPIDTFWPMCESDWAKIRAEAGNMIANRKGR
jgi:hypothetical protein